MWIACGTKFGKTFGASAGLSTRALTLQGGVLRWVAPIYAQTKIGMKYCKKFLPPEPWTKIDNHSMLATIIPNDTTIEFKSGKFPEDLEGEGTHGNILDECAKMSEQVYDSVKTTTTVTRGPIVGISTPRGKNWFYSRCMAAKDQMEWCIANKKPLTHIFITAPSTANPLVSAAAVEDAKRSMPERLFRQYYLAEFMDDGSVFTGYRECYFGPELDHIRGPKQTWFAEDFEKVGTVVVGADWAKTTDYTVFTAFDISTRRLVGYQRFHKTPYTEAVRKLVLFCRRFNDVLLVRHDKTGLGGVIDDLLSNSDLPYEGVTFTNAWKADAVAQLITGIEQKMVFFPRLPSFNEEFEAYEVETKPSGSMTYAATPGRHDDIISSLLLSHTALVQYSDTDMLTVKFVEDLKKPQTAPDKGKDDDEKISDVEAFYRDISEDL
jgi:hypothetical protein